MVYFFRVLRVFPLVPCGRLCIQLPDRFIRCFTEEETP